MESEEDGDTGAIEVGTCGNEGEEVFSFFDPMSNIDEGIKVEVPLI